MSPTDFRIITDPIEIKALSQKDLGDLAKLYYNKRIRKSSKRPF